jgi:hypothetical protein
MLDRLNKIKVQVVDSHSNGETADHKANLEHEDDGEGHLPHLTSALYSEREIWINRIMVHNPAISIKNATRDVLLRYYFSMRTRRGFCCMCLSVNSFDMKLKSNLTQIK